MPQFSTFLFLSPTKTYFRIGIFEEAVVKSAGSANTHSQIWIWILLLTVWSWASSLTSLGHKFLIYEERIKHLTRVIKDKGNPASKAFLPRAPTKGSKMGSQFYYLHHNRVFQLNLHISQETKVNKSRVKNLKKYPSSPLSVEGHLSAGRAAVCPATTATRAWPAPRASYFCKVI